jgi:hypothetical protein
MAYPSACRYVVGPGEDVYATGGIRFQQVSSSAQASRFFR